MEYAFGQFLAGVLAHFGELGMPFDYVSPINEPSVPWDSPKQEGCRYSNQDMTRTVLAVRRALDDAGVDTPILFNEANTLLSVIDVDLIRPVLSELGPEAEERFLGMLFRYGGKYGECVKDVFWNPEIRNAIAPIIACHSYGSDTPEHVRRIRELTRATLGRYPGYDYWMSEYCVLGDYGPGRDLGIDAGLYIANVIHHDLVDLDAAAWQWWLGVSGSDYKDGLVYIDVQTQEVHDSRMLWALGHWSRFLRPGSVRVGLEGAPPDGDLLASGWLDADARPVVVIVNQGPAASLELEAGDVSAWTGYTTDAELVMDEKRLTGTRIDVPARALLTLVAE